MINPKFTIEVKGGKVVSPSFKERTKLIRRLFGILAQKDGRYQIEGKKATKKRSNPQNRYYWGVVIPMITERFIELGNKCDKDLTHEFLKDKFGMGEYLTVNEEEARVNISTTKYTKEEFIGYLELIISWSAQMLDLVIPDPEQAKAKMIY